ncbi:MAG: hypothetical protein AAFZ38_07185 [Myxococcota bacterium]
MAHLQRAEAIDVPVVRDASGQEVHQMASRAYRLENGSDPKEFVRRTSRAKTQQAALVTDTGETFMLTQDTPSPFVASPNRLFGPPPSMASLRVGDVVEVTNNGSTDRAHVVAVHLDRLHVFTEHVGVGLAYGGLALAVGAAAGPGTLSALASGADAAQLSMLSGQIARSALTVGCSSIVAGVCALLGGQLGCIVSELRHGARNRGLLSM